MSNKIYNQHIEIMLHDKTISLGFLDENMCYSISIQTISDLMKNHSEKFEIKASVNSDWMKSGKIKYFECGVDKYSEYEFKNLEWIPIILKPKKFVGKYFLCSHNGNDFYVDSLYTYNKKHGFIRYTDCKTDDRIKFYCCVSDIFEHLPVRYKTLVKSKVLTTKQADDNFFEDTTTVVTYEGTFNKESTNDIKDDKTTYKI